MTGYFKAPVKKVYMRFMQRALSPIDKARFFAVFCTGCKDAKRRVNRFAVHCKSRRLSMRRAADAKEEARYAIYRHLRGERIRKINARG